MNWRADAALPASAAPQSSQNADEGAFSAPHFGQRLARRLPHAAQNFLLVVLSVPHLVQRMRLILRDSDGPPLVSSSVAQRPAGCGRTIAIRPIAVSRVGDRG